MGHYWLHGSSSRGGLWPPFFYRRWRLAGTSHPLCRLRHDFFNGGGWTEAPLSNSSHHVPVLFVPLIYGVGRRDILRQLQIQLLACKPPRQVTDYFTLGTHLVGSCLYHLQLLGYALLCHIVRLSQRHGETSLQASRSIINKRDMGQSKLSRKAIRVP
jgi:hypothetical protein